jgi:lipoprotein-releasing system permease protein
MFEFKFAKKYLLPEKGSFSASLMGVLSTLVIALVIWLVTIFLTITGAMENNWIKKLTSLNAPIRIHPTNNYYGSYYYQIDSFCQASNFSLKTIREKLQCDKTDPYNDQIDEELPIYFPLPNKCEKTPIDPVRDLFASLKKVSQNEKFLYADDYEVCPTMFKQRLNEDADVSFVKPSRESFISQMNFVTSIPSESPQIQSLINAPRVQDLNNLLKIHKNDTKTLKSILSNINVEEFYSIANLWKMPFSLLPEKITLPAYARYENAKIVQIIIGSENNARSERLIKGRLIKSNESLCFLDAKTKTIICSQTPIHVSFPLKLSVNPLKSCQNERYFVSTTLFNHRLDGPIDLNYVRITKAKILYDFTNPPTISPPWAYLVKKSRHKKTLHLNQDSVLLPIHYAEKNSRIGDNAELCYSSSTSTAIQEQKCSVKVAGFYDPGMFNVGARCILADYNLVHQIYAANPNTSLDPIMSNGVQIWCPIKRVDAIVDNIRDQMSENGLSSYWRVVPYYEYEFAKDILRQFKSDRYLFILIGIIILMVACSNIISLLILIVNNKKKQIGILLSLGAKKSSIAAIFGVCAILIGVLSCAIGVALALVTLKNLNLILHCISSIFGSETFSIKLLSSTLPKKFSLCAIWPVFVMTPILSVLAAIIPAYKACKIEPSSILRSE